MRGPPSGPESRGGSIRAKQQNHRGPTPVDTFRASRWYSARLMETKPITDSTVIRYDLGITPSRGRPRVSNDTPYSESLFRTLKYCPQWPQDGFADLDAARTQLGARLYPLVQP
jgi:hypothetical protein